MARGRSAPMPSHQGCAPARPSRIPAKACDRHGPLHPRLHSLWYALAARTGPVRCASASSRMKLPAAQGIATIKTTRQPHRRRKALERHCRSRTPGTGAPLPPSNGPSSRASWTCTGAWSPRGLARLRISMGATSPFSPRSGARGTARSRIEKRPALRVKRGRLPYQRARLC